MRRSTGAALILTLAISAPATGEAQNAPAEGAGASDAPIVPGVQLRPRFETRDPATPLGEGISFTSMRTRVELDIQARDGVSAFVQLQDVRIWGEEASTLGDFSANGLDLHQAWVELAQAEGPLSARLGRQEAVYGGQRLVGAVDWTQQGRAVDGARARYRGDRLRMDVFGFQLQEEAASSHARDASFLGGYATVEVSERHDLDLFALWNRGRGGDTEQATLGLRYVGREGPVEYRLEGAWQGGDRDGDEVSAYLLGARAGTAVGERGRVTLWYDHLSGDEAGDGELGVFQTLFATNHKFYGYADLFLDIPLHTDGRGLRDLALKTTWALAPGWSASVDVHHFRVAESGGLADARLGEELDLTLRHDYTEHVTVSAGLSYVAAGDALAPVRGIDDDVTFAYLMLDFGF